MSFTPRLPIAAIHACTGMVRSLALPKPMGAEVLPSMAETNATRAQSTCSGSVKVMTWNIHYGCGPSLEVLGHYPRSQVVTHLEEIARVIRGYNPDVLALQEVDRDAARSAHIDQLRWLQQRTGLCYAAWTPTWISPWVPHPGVDPRSHFGPIISGQAVLSRYPIMGAFRHPLPQPCANGRAYNHFYLHRALLDVTLRLPTTHGTLRVLNAHLEAFDVANRMIHAEKTKQLAQLAINTGKTPLLLLGDMNSVPEEAAMRHAFPDEPLTDMRADTSIKTLRDVDGLKQAGQPTDTPEQWSFPAENPNRRLDYIFVARLSVEESRVLQLAKPASDHLPVVTTAQTTH